MPSPRSAANPASHPPLPRKHLPGLLPVAASRLVTGLSRASCRDASGLAVLMSTGRRAGCPASRARPRCAPAGQARAHHRPGPSDRHLLPPPAAAAGCRVSRTPGVGPARAPVTPAGMDGRPADGHRAAWSDARPVPGAAANAPEWASGYVPVARPRRQPRRWMLQGCPRPPGCGCLLVTSTPCPAGHGCITGARPSCSRQRPGECAAAGGLCAAEAQLRDPCS
jgi:hypothetical protein